MLAAVATATMSAMNDPTILAAIHRVSDLRNYTSEHLSSTTEWAFVAGGVESRGAAPAGSFSASRIERAVRALKGENFRSSEILDGVYLASLPAGQSAKTIEATFGNTFVWPMVARQQSPRLIPSDPRFPNQWHLRNTGQSGGTVGADANITSVWDNYTGAGVVIGVVDDGVTPGHQDLAPNYNASLSYDFNRNDPIPDGGDHGTSVAGVALSPINGLGGVGAAPAATLAGLQLIDGTSTDSMEANALAYKMQDIDIYTNSWGPFDSGSVLEAPGPLTLTAMRNVIMNGRGGLGGIYTWANGNGGDSDDSNFDGYANSRYTIGIGAITNFSTRSSYSEPGANMLVTTYSNGGSLGINTTSGASNSSYTTSFGGTSSATPLAAGVVALMLQANPNLTWRDVQHILVETAKKVSPSHVDWKVNGAGFNINHYFGFGAIDAAAAVGMAQTWNRVGEELVVNSGVLAVNAAIPNNSTTGISRTFEVTDAIKLENIEVVFTATHASRGELKVVLVSPSGTESILSRERADTGDNFSNWVFGTVRNWGEDARGTWTLKVIDDSGTTSGTWTNWQINLYGTSLGPAVPTIRGTVFDDADADGSRDAEEAGVSGAWAYLDLDNDAVRDAEEPASQTNLAGSFTITNLDAGNYTLRVESIAGRRLTSAATRAVSLGAGQTVTGQDFAVTTKAAVSGVAFDDVNGNGTLDAGEAKFNSSRVYVDSNNNGSYDNTTQTLNSTNVPLTISASGTPVVTSTLTAPATLGTISKVTVRLNITHTWVSDLDITLIAPDGTRVLLTSDLGGSSDNYTNTVFDDAAASPISSGSAPFTGTFRPIAPLSSLNGKAAAGQWKLEVADTVSSDGGTLNSWSITVNSVETSVLTDGSGVYSFPAIAAGNYNLRQVLSSGYGHTNPVDGLHALAAASGTVYTRDFGSRDVNRPLQTGGVFLVDAAAQSVSVSFNEDVVIDPGRILVTNLTTSQVVPSANIAIAFDASADTALITFPGFANGVLPNGNYRLSVLDTVTDVSGALIANPGSVEFFTLAGDVNRDRTVNFDDLLTVAQSYGQSGKVFTQGNVDYSADGVVGFDDLLILAQNYGSNVVALSVKSTQASPLARSRVRVAQSLLG